MIDYVRISSQIPISLECFVDGLWHEGTTPDGSPYLWHRFRGVSVHYYVYSQRLVVSGKFITMLCDTQVSNFDDLYGNMRGQFIDEVNAEINRLFVDCVVDIRDFLVTRIDYCFNVETPFVTQYIEFLTTAFERIDKGTRVNFTAEHGLRNSVYIKNKAEYDRNARYNYTLNVYDKADRLRYQRARHERISTGDFALAENILRIEVQASYNFLEAICRKFSVTRRFEELFNYRIALWAIETVFARVYRMNSTAQFYTYKEACKLVTKGSAAQKTLFSAATNHSVVGKKYAYGCKALNAVGIYPYCLLPRRIPCNILPNPMQLIMAKDGIFIEEGR